MKCLVTGFLASYTHRTEKTERKLGTQNLVDAAFIFDVTSQPSLGGNNYMYTA
jgi:hypothetical protein